jgi:beta-glucosidase
MLAAAVLWALASAAPHFQEAPKIAATTPISRESEPWWRERHARCVELTKQGGFDVAFLGDSITQGWEGAGKAAWDATFAPKRAANFGFSGDRTEHVLWRLANGEIVGATPKVIVIMIGTNNLGHGSSNAEQTSIGVTEIVKTLRDKLPETRILLLGIFPRGRAADDRLRVAAADATQRFVGLDDGRHVHFLDIGKHFIRADGDLRAFLMPDLLHLSPDGYGIWAKAIEPTVARLLAEPGRTQP